MYVMPRFYHLYYFPLVPFQLPLAVMRAPGSAPFMHAIIISATSATEFQAVDSRPIFFLDSLRF